MCLPSGHPQPAGTAGADFYRVQSWILSQGRQTISEHRRRISGTARRQCVRQSSQIQMEQRVHLRCGVSRVVAAKSPHIPACQLGVGELGRYLLHSMVESTRFLFCERAKSWSVYVLEIEAAPE